MRIESVSRFLCGPFSAKVALAAFFAGFVFLALPLGAFGQADRPLRSAGGYGNDARLIDVPAENVHLVSVTPLNTGIFPDLAPRAQSPQAADPAAMWSNITTFSGLATANGGSANQSGNTITRLVADDAVFTGNPPHFLGGFSFCVANFNGTAVSARAIVRLYLDSSGLPGTHWIGFAFLPISFTANTTQCYSANISPIVFPSSNIWLGLTFDNNTGATGATLTQMDNLGVGLYNPVDVGTSADLIFRTTAAGSFAANNPAGGNIFFSGSPVANLGFEMRRAGTIRSIVQSGPGPAGPGSTVTWNVTTSLFTPAVTTSSFALTGTAATGSVINSVTPSNSGGKTTYTVTATVGPNAGNLWLSWANVTNLNNSLTNTLPFTGGTATKADFDGDGKTDVSVFRRSDGNWYLNRSAAGFTSVHWGIDIDTYLTGDYDGDGRADFVVWRVSSTPGVPDFYILNSSGFTVSTYAFGDVGDKPVIGDFDGDGKTDVVVWRPSDGTWYITKSSTQAVVAFKFGTAGDIPVMMDFNADGKADLAVFRPSDRTWYMANGLGTSPQSFAAIQWGLTSDILVPADYDGDGKDDIAVWRPSDGTWYILRSSDGGLTQIKFGTAGDVPVPGDYDGDGKNDVAVYRSGTWYLNQSTAGFAAQAFGLSSDNPIPSAYHSQNGPPVGRPSLETGE